MDETKLAKQQALRLIEARLAAGFKSARSAAIKYGWPESTYSAHERGTRTIGQDDAARYVRKFRAQGAKVSAQYILFGDDQGFDSDEPPDEQAVGTQGRRGLSERALPEFNLTAHGSYGGGYAMTAQVVGENGDTFAADAVKDEWIVPDGWLRVEMQLTYKSTHVLPIDGPSMEPDLKQGDRVFVDLRSRDPKNEGIYVIRDGESIIVKKIQLVRPETDPPRIICKSSAPGYDPFELVLDDVQVSIIGRVAGKLTRM